MTWYQYSSLSRLLLPWELIPMSFRKLITISEKIWGLIDPFGPTKVRHCQHQSLNFRNLESNMHTPEMPTSYFNFVKPSLRDDESVEEQYDTLLSGFMGPTF